MLRLIKSTEMTEDGRNSNEEDSKKGYSKPLSDDSLETMKCMKCSERSLQNMKKRPINIRKSYDNRFINYPGSCRNSAGAYFFKKKFSFLEKNNI